MTNFYKYAFTGGDNSIRLRLEQNGDYKLYYKDSGLGLPQDMDIKSLKSLGMKIMYNLCRQLGGTFAYDTGTKMFIITFKDQKQRKMIS